MADENKKICPMGMNRSTMDEGTAFCQEQRCAWWVPKERLCTLRLIAEDLNHIASHSKFQ